jgi:predicted nucleotidyltransferase
MGTFVQWKIGYFNFKLKVTMSLNFADYSDQLSNLCTLYGVKRLELFGSASRNDFDLAKSDLDFLVEFVETQSRGAFDRYFGLKEALEQLFQRSIDLVEVKAIKNPYFRQTVERDKVLVYET